MRQGSDLVKNTLQLQPENFYKLANTICKISTTQLDLEKHRRMLRKAKLREILDPSSPFSLHFLSHPNTMIPAQVTPSHG